MNKAIKRELRNRGLREHTVNFYGLKWKVIENAKKGEKL